MKHLQSLQLCARVPSLKSSKSARSQSLRQSDSRLISESLMYSSVTDSRSDISYSKEASTQPASQEPKVVDSLGPKRVWRKWLAKQISRVRACAGPQRWKHDESCIHLLDALIHIYNVFIFILFLYILSYYYYLIFIPQTGTVGVLNS